jgi:hypothetical protein
VEKRQHDKVALKFTPIALAEKRGASHKILRKKGGGKRLRISFLRKKIRPILKALLFF